jgi:hypothetical protein
MLGFVSLYSGSWVYSLTRIALFLADFSSSVTLLCYWFDLLFIIEFGFVLFPCDSFSISCDVNKIQETIVFSCPIFTLS